MIGEGVFLAVAKDVQWGETKNGKKQVAVQFELLSGDDMGQTVTWFGYFTDGTWKRTMESLRYMGWRGDDLSDLGPLDQQVEIVVELDEYNGKIRPKVQWVNRPGGGRVKLEKPLGDSELKKFAAQMKQRAKSVPVVAGPTVQTSAPIPREPTDQFDRPLDATGTDDEIPF